MLLPVPEKDYFYLKLFRKDFTCPFVHSFSKGWVLEGKLEDQVNSAMYLLVFDFLR